MKERPLTYQSARPAASVALEAGPSAGVHPKIAQERLGHTTITTKLDLYSHVSQTMQEDAAERIDTAYRQARSGR